MLDPSPYNELGKGVFDPETEQKLLEKGVTYAERVFHPNGKYHLRTATTPIDEIAVNVLAPPTRRFTASLPNQNQITTRIAKGQKV